MTHTPESQQQVRAVLDSTLRHARPTLLRRLASLALIDRRHVACAIATADGRIVATDTPARLGTLRAVARTVCDTFSDNLVAGDIVLTNDPYSGGTHIQDVTLLRPVFVANQIVSWAIVQSPMPDLGGIALGGYYPFALEIWAEGIRVTPAKLYRKGVLQRDARTMLTLNSRLPYLIEKDVENMTAILEQCDADVAAVATSLTPARYAEALDEIVTDTATKTQALLSELPHSEWQAESLPVHSCQEETDLQVKVRVAISDKAVQFDFSGSSAAAKGFVNTTAATTLSAAILPFLALWPSIPANEGIFQHLQISLPDDVFLNAKLPMSVGWSPYGPSQAVVQAVTEALQQAQCALPPAKLIEAQVTPPALPFTIAGCRRNGCPFPAQSK